MLLPAREAARYEALKQIESKSVQDHAMQLEHNKDKLLHTKSLPLDVLLKKYTDELFKYQAYINSLNVTPPPPPPPPPQTPPPPPQTPSFKTPESIEDDEDEEFYTILDIEAFPTSRQPLAKKLFRKMQNDPDVRLVGRDVFLGPQKLGSSKNIMSFFVQQKKEKPPENVVKLAKHWVKEKIINVDRDIENTRLKSILSPLRSPIALRSQKGASRYVSLYK